MVRNSVSQMEYVWEILNGPQLVNVEGVFIGNGDGEELSLLDGVSLGNSEWIPARRNGRSFDQK